MQGSAKMTFKLEELDLDNDEEVQFLFDTRTHPVICANLFGTPPVDLKSHKVWLSTNVPHNRLIFLLKDNGKLIGYCQAYNFDTWMFEAGFAIHPDFHNKGYGKEMVRMFIALMTERLPGRKIVLQVKESNIPALKIYEKTGFIRTDIKDGIVIMEKETYD